MAGTRASKQRQRVTGGEAPAVPQTSTPAPQAPAATSIPPRQGRVRFLSSPVQWFAVFTLAVSAAAAVMEANRQDVRSWSVFVQSAIGIAAGTLAWYLNRWGGRLGVLWGAAQAIVIAVDGNGWIGKQVVATYIGTSSDDPSIATGTTIAVNALGGFFACVWAWFLLKERWSTPRRTAAG